MLCDHSEGTVKIAILQPDANFINRKDSPLQKVLKRSNLMLYSEQNETSLGDQMLK